jgi:hypothetical protein
MQRSFYTQQTFAHRKLLHREAVTQRCWVTQDPNVRALFKDWFANQTCHHCLWKGLVQTQSALALRKQDLTWEQRATEQIVKMFMLTQLTQRMRRAGRAHGTSMKVSSPVLVSFDRSAHLSSCLADTRHQPLYPKKTQCFALRLPPQHKSHATDTISLSHHIPKSPFL